MNLSRVKRMVKIIMLVPLIPIVWVMSRIMREILLSSGCHRCRVMIESGVESDMRYAAHVLREKMN